LLTRYEVVKVPLVILHFRVHLAQLINNIISPQAHIIHFCSFYTDTPPHPHPTLTPQHQTRLTHST
jgi:hypothetical protein